MFYKIYLLSVCLGVLSQIPLSTWIWVSVLHIVFQCAWGHCISGIPKHMIPSFCVSYDISVLGGSETMGECMRPEVPLLQSALIIPPKKQGRDSPPGRRCSLWQVYRFGFVCRDLTLIFSQGGGDESGWLSDYCHEVSSVVHMTVILNNRRESTHAIQALLWA